MNIILLYEKREPEIIFFAMLRYQREPGRCHLVLTCHLGHSNRELIMAAYPSLFFLRITCTPSATEAHVSINNPSRKQVKAFTFLLKLNILLKQIMWFLFSDL